MRNPLRGLSDATFGRVDQGVDYSGSGPLYAIAPGVIDNVYNAGWPGGVYIDERITRGPLAGAYWYAAEDIAPSVAVGDRVTTRTVLGDVAGSIETGFGAPPPDTGESLAHYHGNTVFPTPEGLEAYHVLRRAGAPAPGSVSAPVGNYSGSHDLHVGPFGFGLPHISNPLSSLGDTFKNLAITVPLVLAAAALVVLGLYRASHAGQKIQQVQQGAAQRGDQAAEVAAVAA